ncbi:MAG: hypothetical protein WCD08_08490 [Steroidobacteraceae bacterium]
MTQLLRNALLLGLALWAVIGSVYIGQPLSGHIVDVHTGRGIADAQVVTYWSADQTRTWSVGSGGALQIDTALTDANGTFRFGRWTAWHRWWANLHADVLNDPIIWVFKKGYLPMWMNNRLTGELALPPKTRWGPLLWSRWQDATLPLAPAEPYSSEYHQALDQFESGLEYFVRNANVSLTCGRRRLQPLVDRLAEARGPANPLSVVLAGEYMSRCGA